MNFNTVRNVEALKPGACKNKAVRDPYVLECVQAAEAFHCVNGVNAFRALSPREAAWPVGINLSPALVVGGRYLHLLGRGIAAALGAGDGNCIDASVHRTGNLVRLTSSNSRDGARVHAFVLEVVLERRRFFDYLGLIPRLCVSLASRTAGLLRLRDHRPCSDLCWNEPTNPTAVQNLVSSIKRTAQFVEQSEQLGAWHEPFASFSAATNFFV